MAQAHSERLNRPGLVTVRKENARTDAGSDDVRRRFWPMFWAAAIFVAFGLMYVWSNHEGVQISYEIAQLHKEKADLVDLNRKFKLELANLSSLDRLEKEAKTNLGMITPRPEQIQVIE